MSFLIHKFQYRNYADNINLLLVFLIGISATLTGIGISRFAFSALMPELIMQQWFTASQVAYLSSTNLFGYLVGGIFCLNNKLLPSNFTTLLYASLIVYFSYMACVDSQNFFFFLFWLGSVMVWPEFFLAKEEDGRNKEEDQLLSFLFLLTSSMLKAIAYGRASP